MSNKQIPIVIGIVYNEKGEILVGQRGTSPLVDVSNKWEYPGGKIEFGEDPELAVIREVKEETGLEVKVTSMLPKIFTHVWDHADGSKIQVVIIVYKCEIVSGMLRESEPEKVRHIKFVTLQELKKLQNEMLLPNRYFFSYL